MKQFVASAPSKLILCGEHSVVYGGKAIAVPLDNRKECTVTVEEVEKGKGEIIVEDVVGFGRVLCTGQVLPADSLFAAKTKVIQFILEKESINFDSLRVRCVFSRNKIPKGTGGSASAFASLAIALYTVFVVPFTKEKLFEAVQAGEEVAHGGKASGIDAHTVLSDSPQKFWKEFAGKETKFHFEQVALALPRNTVLVVVNTLKKGQTPETTASLIQRFAEHYRIMQVPADVPEKTRNELTTPFNEAVEKIAGELREKGDAKKLGQYLNDNHFLLKKAGVSSEGIEEALALCRKAGALGGKLTGAGGRGGACFSLVKKENAEKLVEALKEAGFEAVIASFDKRGPHVQRV